MKSKANLYLYLVTMAIMLFTVLYSLFGMAEFESKLLPVMIGSVVLLLAGGGLLSEIRARAMQPEGAAQEPLPRSLVNLGWVVGFLLGIYLLGYVVAILLFVLAYMKWLGTGWHLAVAFAVLTAAFIYAGFEIGLQLQLYRGLLFGWLSR